MSLCGCELEGCGEFGCDQPPLEDFDICVSCEDGEHL